MKNIYKFHVYLFTLLSFVSAAGVIFFSLICLGCQALVGHFENLLEEVTE